MEIQVKLVEEATAAVMIWEDLLEKKHFDVLTMGRSIIVIVVQSFWSLKSE
jgi:hypothetical protein